MLRRSLRDVVAAPALAEPAERIYRALDMINPRVALANARFGRTGSPDELPIPPADLRFMVAGTSDISWFLRAGQMAAQSILDAVARTGQSMTDVRSMLDFGCGCGRVLRHWRSLRDTRICGSDLNPRLVAWCAANLSFAEVQTNQLEPPLAYADAELDLVYALSVFTHLTTPLQESWMHELQRVIKPGGLLVVSAHGQAYAGRLNPDERRRFAAGELVVKNNVAAPGRNTCAAYHPTEYMRERLAAGWDLLDFAAEGATGNPRQDLYVFRRPA